MAQLSPSLFEFFSAITFKPVTNQERGKLHGLQYWLQINKKNSSSTKNKIFCFYIKTIYIILGKIVSCSVDVHVVQQNILGPHKILILKNFWVQKIVNPNKYLSQKSLGSGNFWKNIRTRKNLWSENFGLNKCFCLKNMWVWKKSKVQ